MASCSYSLSALEMAKKALRLDAVVRGTSLSPSARRDGSRRRPRLFHEGYVVRCRAAEGRAPDFVYPEWITRDYAFTVERLRHPTADEKRVMDHAISYAVRSAFSPEPGDGNPGRKE